MEYSLNLLNKNLKLNDIKLSILVDTLNLIGFEVDEIIKNESNLNKNLREIRFLIKIPSNRDDLLLEQFFINELKCIFFFNLINTWKNLKSNYEMVLKKKFETYSNYQVIIIEETIPNLITYAVEVSNPNLNFSPKWIQSKLDSNGLKAFGNIVDIFNLVNFEFGQNLNKIKKTNTLDNLSNLKFDYSYYENNKFLLVLKNKDQILSYLGLNTQSQIDSIENENSQRILIESTYYDIHKNLNNLNFSKYHIPLKILRKSFLENFKDSFERLLTLLELITNIKLENKVYKTSNKNLIISYQKIISLKKENFYKILNLNSIDYSIFKKANLILVSETSDELFFQISKVRIDLTREIDIIEEYSRFIGYKNFVEISPEKTKLYYKNNKENIKFIKNFFINQNFIEVYTNSLTSNYDNSLNEIELINPLNNDLISLRTTLINNLFSLFKFNIKTNLLKTSYFEIGRVFKKSKHKIIEQDKIGGIFLLKELTGMNSSLNWFKAKGLIENFLKNFGYFDLTIENFTSNSSILHPKRTILIKKREKILGVFGELNPKKDELFLKSSIYLFELNLIYLKNLHINKEIPIYQEYSKYPIISKDLSFLGNTTTNYFKIKEKIQKDIHYLKKITFFDIFIDQEFTNKIKIGLHLEFQSKNETLTNEIIEKEISMIYKILKNDFNLILND